VALVELFVVLWYVGVGVVLRYEGWDGGYDGYYGEGCVLLLGEVRCYA